MKGLTNVISLAAGEASTCAVIGATPAATSGAAKCWGNNDQGKLGDGTTTARKLPTQVSGLTSDVTAISTGSGHTCAATSAQTAKCWGDGSSGQLGSGAATTSKVPVAVKNLTGVTTISAGSENSCATTTGVDEKATASGGPKRSVRTTQSGLRYAHPHGKERLWPSSLHGNCWTVAFTSGIRPGAGTPR